MTKYPRYVPSRSETPQSHTDILSEIRDRVRRIETRTTKFIESQGFDTGVVRAKWVGLTDALDVARLDLPGPGISIKEIMAAIPDDYLGHVDLYVGENLIATVYR